MPFSASVIQRIDSEVASLSVSNTPFIRSWVAGELNRDELRAFATQYYHQVAAFPRYVSRLHAECESADARKVLLDVLIAAEAGSPTLSDLWLRTGAALGLFSDSVRASEPTAATAHCIATFRDLCSEGTVEGLAALYACTSQLPSLCREMRDGLETHYGMSQGPGLQFFETREYSGQHHAKLLRDALDDAICCEDDVRAALAASRRACEALTELYVVTPADALTH